MFKKENYPLINFEQEETNIESSGILPHPQSFIFIPKPSHSTPQEISLKIDDNLLNLGCPKHDLLFNTKSLLSKKEGETQKVSSFL